MAKPRIPADQTDTLNVHFDIHHTEITEADRERMRAGLDVVYRAVAQFPQRECRVNIEYGGRNNEYAVKASLLLPGRTLTGSEHDRGLQTAFEKCVDILLHEVRQYKDDLGQVSERQKQEKHTRQPALTEMSLDAAVLDAAVDAGDYPAYRAAVRPIEDELRLRVGRWVERYPELQAKMGREMTVADLTDGVFLAAFERHPSRPMEARYGEWLEGLIDPELRELLQHPEAELENIRMARTAAGN